MDYEVKYMLYNIYLKIMFTSDVMSVQTLIILYILYDMINIHQLNKLSNTLSYYFNFKGGRR